MKKQKVIISEQLELVLSKEIAGYQVDRIFILTDKTTYQLCLPVIKGYDCLQEASTITIEAGDTHKDLESISHVWSELQRMGATRHSLLINLGGGMVTDLGGFAASTFKRGIHYFQTRHSFYQHPHHPALDSRCLCGWQDRYQLRWIEKRNWCVQ